MSQSREIEPPHIPDDAILLNSGGLLELNPSPPPVFSSKKGRKPTFTPVANRLSQLRQQAPVQASFTSLKQRRARRQRVKVLKEALPLFGGNTTDDTAQLFSEFLKDNPDVHEKLYPKAELRNLVGACADYYSDMKSGTKAPFLSRFVSRGVTKKLLQENGWDVSSSQMSRATRLVASETETELSTPRGHRKKLTLKQQAHIRPWYFYCSRVSPNRTNAKGKHIRFLQDTVLNIYTLYKQSCDEQQVKPVSLSSFHRNKPEVCKTPKKVDDKCDTCGRLASVERDMMLLLPIFVCCCGHDPEPSREPPTFSDITPELEEELAKDPTLSEFIDRDLLRVTHENPELEDFDRFITFNRKAEVLAENFEKNVSECMVDHQTLHSDDCVKMRKLLRARPALKAHKYSSKRQQASFQRAIETLTAGKCLIVMDFKENLSLGQGPVELSSHFRNRPQRQLLGAAVLFVDEDGCLKKRYVSFLSVILNKNANFVNQAILHLVGFSWFNFKSTSFWFDKGSTHFWNLEMCCFLLSNFADMGYSVDINFFGAGHGKNLVDGHFSLLSRWKKLAGVRTRVLSSEQLIAEWKQAVKASNLRRIEADLPTLDIDFVDFTLSHEKWVKVPRKIELANFKIWYRFERLAGEEKIRCKLHSNAILKKDFPLKSTLGKPRKGDTWKTGSNLGQIFLSRIIFRNITTTK